MEKSKANMLRTALLVLRYCGITLYSVWVVQLLYTWFLQAIGLPPISYWHALGLVAFILALRPIPTTEEWIERISTQEPARWLAYMGILHLGGYALSRLG